MDGSLKVFAVPIEGEWSCSSRLWPFCFTSALFFFYTVAVDTVTNFSKKDPGSFDIKTLCLRHGCFWPWLKWSKPFLHLFFITNITYALSSNWVISKFSTVRYGDSSLNFSITYVLCLGRTGFKISGSDSQEKIYKII